MPGSRLVNKGQVLPKSTVAFSCDADADLYGPECLNDGNLMQTFQNAQVKFY